MFQNKVCVVTGGANGIGRYMVEEFCKAKASVAFIDMDKAKGELLLKTLNENCMFYHGDVGNIDDLKEFSKLIIDKYEKVDYLINNAMINKGGILNSCSYEDFNYCLQVGITAPYMLTNLLKNNFNKFGSIINIASTRAYMSQSNTESYTAAKGGIVALTHALSISLAGKVRVNINSLSIL